MGRIYRSGVVVIIGVIVSAVAFAQTAFPQALEGMWKGNVHSNDGPVLQELTLFVTGDKLTGTFSNPYVSLATIEEGTITSNGISFKLRLQTRVLTYRGTLADGVLSLTRTVIEGEPLDPVVLTFEMMRVAEPERR